MLEPGPRGLRVPSRNALLADVVPPASYGRAYGFERAMDNLGAIGGPLLALGLIAAFNTRTAIMLAGIGIGLVETAEHAAVATFAPERIRGSAFGLLAAVQSFGNLGASLIVGLLYTLVSLSFAFGYAAVVMVVALGTLAMTTRGSRTAGDPT